MWQRSSTARLVSRYFHSYLLVHTDFHQILDRRTTEIVNDEASITWVRFLFNFLEFSQTGCNAGFAPCFPKIGRVKSRAFFGLDLGQHLHKDIRKRDRASFAVLSLIFFKTDIFIGLRVMREVRLWNSKASIPI